MERRGRGFRKSQGQKHCKTKMDQHDQGGARHSQSDQEHLERGFETGSQGHSNYPSDQRGHRGQSYRGRGRGRGRRGSDRQQVHSRGREPDVAGEASWSDHKHQTSLTDSSTQDVPKQASSNLTCTEEAPARGAFSPTGTVPQLVAKLREPGINFKQGNSGNFTGTKGKLVIVKANYFPVQNYSKEKAFHYDVSFSPDKPKTLFQRVLKDFNVKHFPDKHDKVAFDGKKNLYSMVPLFIDKNELTDHIKVYSEEKKKEREFKIVLKHVACVDLSQIDQNSLQVLEIALRSAATTKMVPVGRTFFSFNELAQPITEGLEIRSGMHLGIKQGQKNLFVNADTVHKPFLKPQSVIDTVSEIGATPRFSAQVNLKKPLQNFQIFHLKNMLKGQKVIYEVTGCTYSVCDVSSCPLENLTFEYNGQNITVGEYFKDIKKIPLRYPSLPCLNVGNSKNPVYFPLELCIIPQGQTVKRITPKIISELIRFSVLDSTMRQEKIMNGLTKLDLNNTSVMKAFQMHIILEFQKINARVLEPPTLDSQKTCEKPRDGMWHFETLHRASTLKNWSILILDRCVSLEDVTVFAKTFQDKGQKLGMTIDSPLPIKSVDTRRRGDLMTCMQSYKQLDLLIIVGYKNSKSEVKKIAELKTGLLTQCIINSSTLMKNGHKDYLRSIHNLILKVNAKLGGVNHVLNHSNVPSKFSNKNVMFVGADVTHPTADPVGTPSIAAVCASHDSSGFQYNMEISIQDPRKEIIGNLENIMLERLKFFESKMNKKPDIIMFYRDGVGEGQFKDVINNEVPAIKRACSKLSLNYKPDLIFVVVQKRHRTRFFPAQPPRGKNLNVSPGTVVDNTITNPEEQMFFLVSHFSPRGVSRPCRYSVLCNDNGSTADELQAMTYNLCHLYSRCERSVSYPAPTYYAHHAATRGKMYWVEENGQNYNFLEKYKSNMSKLNSMFFV